MGRRIAGIVVGGPLILVVLLFFLLIALMQGGAASMGGAGGALADAEQAAQKCTTTGGGTPGPGGSITPINPGNASGQFTAEQKANAARIVEQVKVDVPAILQRQAAVVALATAMQESTLRNLNYGDRDSIGLFQQRNAWASRAERLDPHTTTHLFLTGGHGGQRGLLDIPNWATMPVTQAAQAVQVSAFPLAYARWEKAARGLAADLMGAAPAPAPSPSPSASAPDLRCPTDPTPGPGAGPGPAPGKGGWVAPLPAGSWVMTSPFGWRMHPVVHAMRLHTGDDLAAPNGTPIYAVYAGTVKAAAPNDGYGNQAVVSHGGGVDSAYNHMSAFAVKAGDKVKAGQLVGKVGSTGMSTGNHLHFEIRISGKPIDPVPFMAARGVKLDVK